MEIILAGNWNSLEITAFVVVSSCSLEKNRQLIK